MPPTIHLIRHAEGMHNLSAANYDIHDPGLTARGEQQARDLAARITELQADGGADIDLVLASPLRRTLATALAGFAPQLARKRPAAIYAWPDVQEVSALPCDSGSALAAVQKEFGQELVNYDMVENGWELKQGKYANTEPAVTARAQAAREWLRKQPHKDIVIFSHGCLLHFLTDDWEGTNSPQGTDWDNTELRSFTFSSDEKNDVVLVETLKSRERRGSAPALTGQEQKCLRKTTMRLWTEWGILESITQ